MVRNSLPPVEQIGDVAGQLPGQFYDVNQAELVAAYPSISTGVTALTELVQNLNLEIK